MPEAVKSHAHNRLLPVPVCGLLGHPDIESAAMHAIQEFSTGTHGVRLLAGTTSLHVELEKKIAQFKRAQQAVVFSSGYVTNMTTISALVGRGDYVFCDKLNHASIVDGCLLSGAVLRRFNHNNMHHLAKLLAGTPRDKNKLVVLTIHTKQYRSRIERYFEKAEWSLPVLLDTNGKTTRNYKITRIPKTFFIDEHGIIQKEKLGRFNSTAEIESILERESLLGSKP